MAWYVRAVPAAILSLVASLSPGGPAEGAFDGPYTGKVLDGETGKPVAGAAVLVAWKRIYPGVNFRGAGDHAETAQMLLITTGPTGEYTIPRTNIPTGLASRLARVELVIYEPGYEVYGARRHYREQGSRQSDFPPQGHTVRLKQISLGFDHADHLKRIEELVPHMSLKRNPITRQWEAVTYRDQERGYSAPEREEFLRRTAWEKVMIDPTRQKR